MSPARRRRVSCFQRSTASKDVRSLRLNRKSRTDQSETDRTETQRWTGTSWTTGNRGGSIGSVSRAANMRAHEPNPPPCRPPCGQTGLCHWTWRPSQVFTGSSQSLLESAFLLALRVLMLKPLASDQPSAECCHEVCRH